jgi:hypothetical protein
MAFSSTRTFGVELEIVVPFSVTELSRKLTAAGVPCESLGYSHTVTSGWKVVTDSSVPNTGGYDGMELVSPILKGADGLKMVEKVVGLLLKWGCNVTRSCGTHVHVDGRDLGLDGFKQLVQVHAKYEGTMDKLVAENRQEDNQYCQSNRWQGLDVLIEKVERATTIEEVAKASNAVRYGEINTQYGSRYRKLNLQSYWRQGTVEFRQLQGTLDAKLLVNWIKMAVAMVEGAATRDTGRWDQAKVTTKGADTHHLFFSRYIMDAGVSRFFKPLLVA